MQTRQPDNCSINQSDSSFDSSLDDSSLDDSSLDSSSDYWYLASAKPRQEQRAVENLANQEIRAFSPMIKVEKIRAGKKVVVEEAMFASYVFINLSQEDGLWHKVRSTRGIRNWVRFSGQTAKLPGDLINSLIHTNNNQQDQLIKPCFEAGELVSILSGPFAGLKGVYQASSGEERSMILIQFLGNSNRLNLSNCQITKA